MQDEHFMKLWVEAHTFSASAGTATDVLGGRFDMLRQSVGSIRKTYGRQAPSPAPLPGARAQLAKLFARAIPAGVLAGIVVAGIGGVSAPTIPAPLAATAQVQIPRADTQITRFDLPYAA